MAWVVIIIIIVIFIAAISKSNKKPPEKYFKYSNDIIKSDNERKERIARGEHDEMYFAWKDRHQGKSLEQIEQYIKSRREESWRYWQDNRLEYKILMELRVTLQKEKDDQMRVLLASDRINQLSYDELYKYYIMIKYNQHIYGDIDFNKITSFLDERSFQKYLPLLQQKTPSTATRWLKGRESEGEYISDKLWILADEMEKSESSDIVYKRTRKNIQSNISKAKKEGDWIKIEELEQKLITLEKTKES